MADDNGNGTSESGITTPLGSLSFKGKRTAEFITIVSLLVTAVLAALYWKHDEATAAQFKQHNDTTSETFREITGALKEQTLATRESAQAQRYMACIISEPQNDRPRAETRERCKELSRLP